MPNVSLYCALDARDRPSVERLAGLLAPAVGGLKLGLEYFCAHGPEGVYTVRTAGRPLFLDLKLHDIPNTVAGAVRSVVALEPHYLTIHAAGGVAMMQAAREAAAEEAARRDVAPPNLLGVTVLTSLDADALERQGIAGSARDQVLRLAALAHEAGLAGVIASPHEIVCRQQPVGERVIENSKLRRVLKGTCRQAGRLRQRAPSAPDGTGCPPPSSS